MNYFLFTQWRELFSFSFFSFLFKFFTFFFLHVSYLAQRINVTYRCKIQWGDLILNPPPPPSSFAPQVSVPRRNPFTGWKPHPRAPAFPRRDLGLEIGSRGRPWMGACGFFGFRVVLVIQREKRRGAVKREGHLPSFRAKRHGSATAPDSLMRSLPAVYSAALLYILFKWKKKSPSQIQPYFKKPCSNNPGVWALQLFLSSLITSKRKVAGQFHDKSRIREVFINIIYIFSPLSCTVRYSDSDQQMNFEIGC